MKPRCAADFTGYCQNFMYDISKFEKGEEFVNSLPIILFFGGMHGDEVTGINVLYQLINIFEKYGLKN